MKIAYFSITKQGKLLAERLNEQLPGTLFGKEDLKENLKKAFSEYDGLVCIMAAGIVVRILAPLFVHKQKDPAVVIMDSRGEYAVSLLSGHLGGGNELARRAAEISGGQAVITTATDVEGTFAVDLFAKKNKMKIENIDQLKYISMALLESNSVQLLDTCRNFEIPEGRVHAYEETCPDPVVVISDRLIRLSQKHCLYLRPRSLWIGIGCKEGVPGDKIVSAVENTLRKYELSELSICGISTIPKKKSEPGIIETALHFDVELRAISTERINQLDFEQLKIKQSSFVEHTVGSPSVSTASAYLASGCGEILVDKEIFSGITVSVVRKK